MHELRNSPTGDNGEARNVKMSEAMSGSMSTAALITGDTWRTSYPTLPTSLMSHLTVRETHTERPDWDTNC